ncbi:MAG: hypothetical protein NAOJABEB_02131 [Steroidobacteraceae bacterium]|nr:hypothetical protein [Steroidobacteraceae bacterium]
MNTERRGTAWPWILVPICALIVFFGLRSCKETQAAPQTAAVAGL